MPTITVPDDTYRRLAERAAAQGTTVERLAAPALEQLASQPAGNGHPATPPTDPAPLTGDAWRQKFEELNALIQSRADRYPPGHVLDVSRDAIYGDREDSQL